MKRQHTRKHLEGDKRCVLCHGIGWHPQGKTVPVRHEADCLLADPGVTHVQIRAIRAKVVLRGPRDADGKLHWTSSGSGVTYDIERCGTGRYTYYVMHERSTGKAIFDNARLRDIRQYINDNQGVL